MSIFRRNKRHLPEPVTVEQAVIAHFKLSDDEFGGSEQRNEFLALEDRLIGAIDLARVGEYDGNEFGGGEVVAYMYGPDADRLFETVEDHLRDFAARPAFCVLRYGKATDPDAAERRIEF